ncbi:MAG TPA: STAS domain-containing protein [Pseudonocardia sp.]|jgi:anti-anti-sigma regulatory factor|nr:STAS domain-containing protein [Pseudonocardia sp.]
MDSTRAMQLAVESGGAGTEVIRVAGELTGETGARLVGLLDRVANAPGAPVAERVVVDLGGVRSFEIEGVELLHRAGRLLGGAGVRLVLAGVDARRGVLPRRVDKALDGFRTVPDLERALAAGRLP